MAPGGNYISEWFGHRLFPSVNDSKAALQDQKQERCPFLTAIIGEDRDCVKPDSSKGVCTISTSNGGVRQDWLVCPYRALQPSLIAHIVAYLFGEPGPRMVTPAPALANKATRVEFERRARAAKNPVTFFESKLGGEISIPRTDASPEMSFDVTLAEIVEVGGTLDIGNYGILEVQTMDFHGTYRHAVANLRNALQLHEENFHEQVRENTRWLSQSVEGPNIANVFKRTFYQMAFKFQLASQPMCVGSVLAIPSAVWESWQRHLGAPSLRTRTDGNEELSTLTSGELSPPPAWIFVFQPDAASTESPNPLRVEHRIATNTESLAHFALEVAPMAAVGTSGTASRIPEKVRERLLRVWPEFGTS